MATKKHRPPALCTVHGLQQGSRVCRQTALAPEGSNSYGFVPLAAWQKGLQNSLQVQQPFPPDACLKVVHSISRSTKGSREPNRAHLCFSNVSSSQRLASTANTTNTQKVNFRSTVAIKVPLGSCGIGSTRHCCDPRQLEPSAVPQQSRHCRARPGTVHTGQIGQPAMQASNIIELSAA